MQGYVLDGDILPCYDVLHTFSKDCIMDDLVDLLKKRGRWDETLYDKRLKYDGI